MLVFKKFYLVNTMQFFPLNRLVSKMLKLLKMKFPPNFKISKYLLIFKANFFRENFDTKVCDFA